MTKTNSENTESNHSFLRAARAGNLAKVIDFLETGTDINTCNDIDLTALHLASKEGHVEVVEELIRRGPRIDATTKKGNTALHIASLAGKFEVVKILVENSASVNYQSTNGFTPLYMAAQENHLDVVTFLLNNGADQTITTEDGFTPLAVALQQGHEKVVALLLENDNRSKQRMPALHIAVKKNDVNSVNLLLNSNDVDVNYQSSSGFTPLHIAAHYGNDRSAGILIEHKADVNFQAKNNITPLHVAAKWGRSGMVQLLIDSGALVICRTRDGLTPLHCSARSGHTQLCEKLIDYGADVQAKTRNGLTPLHMAAQGDFDDAARLLIIKRANINETTTDFLTPLHVTAHYGNEKVARVLLDRRCDPNSRALNGFTPLHIACKKHKIKIVELLLKFGALIEATTETGLTPLHVSAFIGSKEAVNMLLQKGANIEQATMRGETALHLATRNNQTDTVKLLLKVGAVPDAKARENQTPLHIATKIGNIELITLFLQNGANPNVATRDNYTALHVAAKEGRIEAISQLLDNGADIEAQTKRNFTPLHIAAKYDKVSAATTLLQRKANPNATGKNGLTPLHVATHYSHEKIAQLLLDNNADSRCKAKNGYSPLHIAAKMNNMDLATMLLVNEADSNAESRNGFSPLQLASQEGHTDMVSLLLLHKAEVNHQAKNGLTSLHLASQEDRVNVAKILIHAGVHITPRTSAGYTPLHTAAHFGQINVAKYLISLMNKDEINDKTELGFTGLHLAAQQGHLQLIYLLLDNSIDPNIRNNQGWTAAHIARRQHYLNIFDVLRKVTTEVISWEVEEEETEEIVILEKPENMGEHAVSDSEDEGVEMSHRLTRQDTDIEYGGRSLDRKVNLSVPKHDDVFRLSTSNDDIWKELEYMKNDTDKKGKATTSSQSVDSRGDESFHEGNNLNDSTDHKLTEIKPEKIESSHVISDEAYKAVTSDWDFEPENVPIVRQPVTSGFLVSFMVDARGGCMQAQRYPNLKFYVPPSSALGPTRLVCRLIKPNKISSPPSLNDGDGFACRLIEMGPCHMQFNAPILIEVPHYASLRGREREIIILRSDNGETWKEHPLEATDQAIQNSVGLTFNNLVTNEEIKLNRIQRILTTDLPQYFAIITRIRQEVALIGPEGLVMSSSVVPQVQAVFPEGALLKKTRVGIQAHEISPEIVIKHCGNRVACSPIISIEPRRRKFHKPITLTVPLPKSLNKGMINDPNNASGVSTLRLLCSITGGSSPAVWEDITGSTPLSFHKDCVSFTTTVSARLWLIDCPNIQGVAEMATNVYRDSIVVPYIGQFVVYGRRHDKEEAQFRILAITDDSIDKTLEYQENFQLIASGPLVEILHKRPHWIETAGNLVPVTKTGEQLSMIIEVSSENRLCFLVRVKDIQQEPKGKLAILMYQRNQGLNTVSALGTSSVLKPITTLEISFPIEIVTPSDTLRRLKMKTAEFVRPGIDQGKVTKSELDFRNVADCIGDDWRILARRLGITDLDDLSAIENNSTNTDSAYAVLMLWKLKNGANANGNDLELALRDIGRDDVVNNCMVIISYSCDDDEVSKTMNGFEKSDSKHGLFGRSMTTPSVDESMVVEVEDETESQRAKEMRELDETKDMDDFIITPVINVRAITKSEDNKITAEDKTKAYVDLIDKLDDLLPTVTLDSHDVTTYEDFSAVREDDVVLLPCDKSKKISKDEIFENKKDKDSYIVPMTSSRIIPKVEEKITTKDKTNAFVNLTDKLNDVLPTVALSSQDQSAYENMTSIKEDEVVIPRSDQKKELKTNILYDGKDEDSFIVPITSVKSIGKINKVEVSAEDKTTAFVDLIDKLNDVLPTVHIDHQHDSEHKDLESVTEDEIVVKYGEVKDGVNDKNKSESSTDIEGCHDTFIVPLTDLKYNQRPTDQGITAKDKTTAFVDLIDKLNDVLPTVHIDHQHDSEHKDLVEEDIIIVKKDQMKIDIDKEEAYESKDKDTFIVPQISSRISSKVEDTEIKTVDKTNVFVDLIDKIDDMLPNVNLDSHDDMKYKDLESVTEDEIVVKYGEVKDGVNDKNKSESSTDIEGCHDTFIVPLTDLKYNQRSTEQGITAEDKTSAFVDLIDKLNDTLPSVSLQTCDENVYKDSTLIKEDEVIMTTHIDNNDKSKMSSATKDQADQEQLEKEDSGKGRKLRDTYAEYKPQEPLSPFSSSIKETICDFERNSEAEDTLPLGKTVNGIKVSILSTGAIEHKKVLSVSDTDEDVSIFSEDDSHSHPSKFTVPVRIRSPCLSPDFLTKQIEVNIGKSSHIATSQRIKSTVIDFEGNVNNFKRRSSICDAQNPQVSKYCATMRVKETREEVLRNEAACYCRLRLTKITGHTCDAPTIAEAHISLDDTNVEMIRTEKTISRDFYVRGEINSVLRGNKEEKMSWSSSSSECDLNFKEDVSINNNGIVVTSEKKEGSGDQ